MQKQKMLSSKINSLQLHWNFMIFMVTQYATLKNRVYVQKKNISAATHPRILNLIVHLSLTNQFYLVDGYVNNIISYS